MISDIDDGERGDRLGIAGLVEVIDRDRERDRARAEQQDRRAQFLDRRHEDQQPAREQARPDQRQRHLAQCEAPRGAENARAFFQRRIDLAHRRVGGAHAERHIAADIGQQQDGERSIERNGHGQPELDQRHRHHDAGQAERDQRGIVEQLAAREFWCEGRSSRSRRRSATASVAARVASNRAS